VLSNIRLSGRKAFDKLARSPSISLPMGKRKMSLATDRVRAAPAVTPTLSGAIGMTAIGLGVAGLFFPKAVSRSVGARAPAPVVQGVFGLRELWSGFSLMGDPTRTGVLWARVAGDVFDMVALKSLDRPSNLKRGNARFAFAVVALITALDMTTAVRMSAVRRTCP